MLKEKSIEDTFEKIASVSHLIKWIGNPVLRTECKEIPVNEIATDDTYALANKLTSTLQQIRDSLGLGRGLAAPQIGVAKRMVVVFLDDAFEVYVNPIILHGSDTFGVYPEMCLSAMPMAAEVTRHWEIEVEYFDIKGIKHRKTASPILSRLLQHEIEHLDGIMFIDKADLKTIRFVDNLDEYLINSSLTQI